MFLLKLCISVSLLVGLCHGFFQIINEDEDLYCKSSSVQCLGNKKSFVTCVNANNLTILSTVLHCPEGYYCDDSTKTPCVADTATISTTLASTTSTLSTTLTPSIITASPTELTSITEVTTSSTNEKIVTTSSDNTDKTDSSSTDPAVTSTITLTTKKKVARPTGAPTCTSTGLYAAPACNQYYECVQKVHLFLWKYYEAVLRTCIDGDYYDTGSQQCMLAILSDCE